VEQWSSKGGMNNLEAFLGMHFKVSSDQPPKNLQILLQPKNDLKTNKTFYFSS
jgi:hypothetical protein